MSSSPQKAPDNKAAGIPPIQPIQHFCRACNIAPVSAWRYEKRGWIKTINISGRRYITAEAVMDFLRRAEAGEFSRTPVVPVRHPVVEVL